MPNRSNLQLLGTIISFHKRFDNQSGRRVQPRAPARGGGSLFQGNVELRPLTGEN